jgi:mycofactocin glycosyltransferase
VTVLPAEVPVIPSKRAGGDTRTGSAGAAGIAWDSAQADRGLVPAGARLLPDAGTRLVAGGTVLVGGSPVRVLRLTPAGARQVAAWFAGAPVSPAAGGRSLARRLLDAGIAHPRFSPGEGPGAGDVTVIIPVRDRHAELDRCLSGLAGCGARVIVVDDGSADPAAIAAIAARHGASVEHRPLNGGPGAARNTGLAAAGTELIAFLDSDCVPRPGWLDGLLPHFADPAVGAVAPRIVPAAAGDGWLARYEGASSTLDLGARPSAVRPGARVSYVPGAALVVRRAAAGDGFNDSLYVGEDVDFVWRLGAAGWRVRYEPRAVMGHDHRVTFRAWFKRRVDYGTSAAALERLHPGAVRPLYASWWTVGAWAAALSGRPVTAAALTAAATALLARRLSRVAGERWPLPAPLSPAPPLPAPSSPASPSDNSIKRPREAAAWRLAVRLAGGGTLNAGRPIGSALSRAWWPAAIPLAVAVRKARLPVAALILVPPLLDWADRRPPLGPARYVAARLLDDAAYSIGVWQGCLARRTVRPLLPVIGGKRLPGSSA